jgi:type VI secretion system protein ImpH
MPDAVTLFERFAADASRFDFFQAVRLVECAHRGLPRVGASLRPRDDAIRFSQEPELTIFPMTLRHFAKAQHASAPKLVVNFFGLLGPNGPMPTHLTEYVRERLRHSGDPTFARFLDVFHHRMVSLFYRAWAAAQPVVSLDRCDDDRFSAYVGTVFGLNEVALRNRDMVPDFAKLHVAGLLAGPTRHAAGLRLVLVRFFGLPVEIVQNVGHWMTLPWHTRSRLGACNDSARIGRGVTLGARVFDCQHKFRIVLGPLSLVEYECFLPGGASLARLVDWVRLYVRDPLDWEVNLQLRQADVPRLALGKRQRLGYTAWLHARAATSDAMQLMLQPLASFHAED